MENNENSFNNIAPYASHEINNALKRIAASKEFAYMASYVFPEQTTAQTAAMIKDVTTADDFQKVFMHKVVRRVIEKTADGLTYDGFDKLDAHTPYLFIANHRDIVLDSAILQVLLVEHQMSTTEITLGSNLMSSPFSVDFAKVNKMFTVYRRGTKIEMLKNSKILSAYIRDTLTKKKNSVWIAQRNGRTKDGFDKTEVALLKMLNLSGGDSLVHYFKELNIVPLSISYEYEPCALLKVMEVLQAAKGPYQKKPDEDFQSILKGITQYKGRIHLSAAQPLNSKLSTIKDSDHSVKQIEKLATLIDKDIYENFKLWPSNYIAHDLLYNKDTYSNRYAVAEKNHFVNYLEKEMAPMKNDLNVKRKLMELYAAPLNNKNL